MEGNIARVLGGPWSAKEPDRPETQLRLAMAQLDLDPPSIVLDGQLHRFPVGSSKDAGWYVAYGDGVPAGMFGNWKTGEAITFRADVGRKLTAAEEMAHARRVAELKRKRDEDTERKHENAAEVANKIWTNAGIADSNHPYLQRKGVKAHILRITGDGRLIAPMYDADGNISSLQYISSDGAKSFHPGGAVRGCYAVLGEPAQDIYIAEGYATGATIYETIHKAVVITYSAGNIPPVTETIRAKYPTASITIVADNDASGVGQNYAEQAAAKYGARVIVSPVASDVNDFVQGGGDLASLLSESTNKFGKYIITPDNLQSAFLETLKYGWIIKDILPESSGLSMIYGAPGTYKSFIAIDMALSMANGVPWQGKKTKQRPVLYIAAEGQVGVLKRFEAWRIKQGLERIDNISLLPIACILDDSSDFVNFLDLLRHLPIQPEYIFIDTLARSMAGEENAKTDMAIVINAIDCIRQEFDMKVILVHHSGKDETKGPRGSLSLAGATDTMFKVERGNKTLSAVMKCERQKDDSIIEPMDFNLEIIDTGRVNVDGDQVTSLVPVYVENPASKILEKADVDMYLPMFMEAVNIYGDPNGMVSHDDLKQYLIDNMEGCNSAVTARNNLSQKNGKFISPLLRARVVDRFENGKKIYFKARSPEVHLEVT